MVKCELCGRLFKTPQGLRGHKTFFHGQYAKRNETIEIRDNGLNKSDERLERLNKAIQSITDSLADLKENLDYLQARITSRASRNELHRIALEIDRLNNQVEKHDKWLNPRGIHEAIVNLDGGPIASIERRLGVHQVFKKRGRKNLRPKL